jgi:hypothetical protein
MSSEWVHIPLLQRRLRRCPEAQCLSQSRRPHPSACRQRLARIRWLAALPAPDDGTVSKACNSRRTILPWLARHCPTAGKTSTRQPKPTLSPPSTLRAATFASPSTQLRPRRRLVSSAQPSQATCSSSRLSYSRVPSTMPVSFRTHRLTAAIWCFTLFYCRGFEIRALR